MFKFLILASRQRIQFFAGIVDLVTGLEITVEFFDILISFKTAAFFFSLKKSFKSSKILNQNSKDDAIFKKAMVYEDLQSDGKSKSVNVWVYDLEI